jgi:energy-coupling factor transporter ATP-binding protein EcfA2
VIAWLLGIVRHKAVDILRGIDLEIGSGMFGLLGPNGAGKTTVIRILAGIVSPGAGSVRINGYDLASGDGKSAVKAMLGYLPQELGLDPELTARQPGTTDPRGGGQGVDGRQRGSLAAGRRLRGGVDDAHGGWDSIPLDRRSAEDSSAGGSRAARIGGWLRMADAQGGGDGVGIIQVWKRILLPAIAGRRMG